MQIIVKSAWKNHGKEIILFLGSPRFECSDFNRPVASTVYVFFCEIQCRSENWACLVFKWSKVGRFQNGPVLEWHLKTRLKFPVFSVFSFQMVVFRISVIGLGFLVSKVPAKMHRRHLTSKVNQLGGERVLPWYIKGRGKKDGKYTRITKLKVSTRKGKWDKNCHQMYHSF